jgi:dienelactone hydrolase
MERTKTFMRIVQRVGALFVMINLTAAWLQPTALPVPRKPDGESARLFAYDRSVAFDLKEASAREQDGVIIRDVNYAAYTQQRGRIKAYLVKPAGKGPFAGVLFFHWYGSPNGNRDQFLGEAVALARRGTVSLLIQGHFPWAVAPTDGQTDRQRVIDETIEVRRALDLLLSQPQVNRKRIGYVGHDYGAMYGAIVAGVDKRVKAYVLMAPIGSFSYWSLAYWLAKTAAPAKEAYRQALNAVDPISHISRATPAALLFQFANSDEHIPKTEANAFQEAASKPKEVKWYDAKHDLHVEAAAKDRREWLTGQLALADRDRN